MRYKKILITLFTIILSTSLYAQELLSLRDAISKGLENNYKLKMYAKSSEIASINNSWSNAGAYPSVELSFSGIANDDMSTTTLTAQLGVDVRWTLFNGFSIKTTKSMLENNEEFSKGTEMLQIENTIRSIMAAYYFVKIEQERLNVAQEILKISQDRYSRELHASEIGSQGTYELIQAKNAFLEDSKTLITRKLSVTESIQNFNLILGLEPTAEWNFTDSIIIPEKAYSLSEMQRKMQNDNSTLKNQYINLKARDLDIKQSESGLYPNISLSAGIAGITGGMRDRNESFRTATFIKPNAGVTLSYNIFNNGKTKRNINIAKINKDIETISTDDMLLTLTKELNSFLDKYDTYKELRNISDQQMEVAKINLDLSTDRYEKGTINSFNYRDVQLSYMNSAMSRLQTIYELLITDIDLLQITGGILTSK